MSIAAWMATCRWCSAAAWTSGSERKRSWPPSWIASIRRTRKSISSSLRRTTSGSTKSTLLDPMPQPVSLDAPERFHVQIPVHGGGPVACSGPVVSVEQKASVSEDPIPERHRARVEDDDVHVVPPELP